MIEEKKTQKYHYGSFTGFKLLAGRGPNVKIKIIPIGNVETNLQSEFVSQGINQTLHRIYLKINCKLEILTPFEDITKNVENQVLLMENVIIGHIPETYYNLEGMESSGDTLNVVQ